MKAVRMIKVSDEGNCLGYDEIVFLARQITKEVWRDWCSLTDHVYVSEVNSVVDYEYEYFVIADGVLTTIMDNDWIACCNCYKHEDL